MHRAGGPRYVVCKDFVQGEGVAIGEWAISTWGLPLHQGDGVDESESSGA